MKNEYAIRGNDVVIFVKGYDRIFECIVDKDDFKLVDSIENSWYVVKRKHLYYVYYQPYIDGKRRTVQLHQFLMGTFGKKFEVIVDHIDGDTMNNKRNNLQLISQMENVHKGRLFSTNTTGYKHIQWRKTRNKYRVEVQKYGIYKCVGHFETLSEAVTARDVYLRELENSRIPRPTDKVVSQ